MPIPLVIFLILFLFLYAYSSHFFLLIDGHFFLSIRCHSLLSSHSIRRNITGPLFTTNPLCKMATEALPAGNLGLRVFYPPVNISYNLSAFSIKDEGRHFPSDIKGFLLISSVGIFFYCLWCKKTRCELKKNLFNTDGNFHQQRCTFLSG